MDVHVEQHRMPGGKAGAGVDDYEQVEGYGQLFNPRVGEGLQRAFFPGDLHVRVELTITLGGGDHRGETAAVVPGDAAQADEVGHGAHSAETCTERQNFFRAVSLSVTPRPGFCGTAT